MADVNLSIVFFMNLANSFLKGLQFEIEFAIRKSVVSDKLSKLNLAKDFDRAFVLIIIRNSSYRVNLNMIVLKLTILNMR